MSEPTTYEEAMARLRTEAEAVTQTIRELTAELERRNMYIGKCNTALADRDARLAAILTACADYPNKRDARFIVGDIVDIAKGETT